VSASQCVSGLENAGDMKQAAFNLCRIDQPRAFRDSEVVFFFGLVGRNSLKTNDRTLLTAEKGGKRRSLFRAKLRSGGQLAPARRHPVALPLTRGDAQQKMAKIQKSS
jgi:hypothetical protein